MTKRLEAIGFDRPFIGENQERVEDRLAAIDPTRKAIRYVGECVKFGLRSDPDPIGEVISANTSEVLLMPYVSVLPIPGQAPAIALVIEGKPLSVSPSAIERIEPVPKDYLEAYVLGLKSEYNIQGENKNGS